MPTGNLRQREFLRERKDYLGRKRLTKNDISFLIEKTRYKGREEIK